MWRDRRIAIRKILRREYFLGRPVLLPAVEKALATFDGRNRPFRVCACVVR